jgi:hypothetical protein
VVLAMLAGFLGACPWRVESPAVSAPAPASGLRWQSATFTLAGVAHELPMARATQRSVGPSPTVLLLLDDLLYPKEAPQAVVPAAWVETATVVVLPLSRLVTEGQPMGPARLEGHAQTVHELGAELRASEGGPVVLVANSLATMVGARAVARESTPFAGYVGAGQLTSLAEGHAWLRATGAAQAVVDDGRWWWLPLARPGLDAAAPDAATAAFFDALDHEDLRSQSEVQVPMVVLAGLEDRLVPEHHLQQWAGALMPRSTEVVSTPGGHDVLRVSPQAVSKALWSLTHEATRAAAGDPSPSSCEGSCEPWRGATTSVEEPSVLSARRYDTTAGTLTPLPRVATDQDRARACDPELTPSSWPSREDHRRVAYDWYPGSYKGLDKILNPPALRSVFRSIKRAPAPEAREGLFMVCEVRDRTGIHSDVAATLEIEDDITIGSATPNAGRTYVWVPALALSPATKMTIGAKDVNVLIDDSLGSVELRYDGHWPLDARNDAIMVECRALDRSAVLRRLDDELDALDRALDELDRALAQNPDQFPTQVHWDAWLAIEPVVAFLGWADPCPLAWLDRLTAARQRWFESRVRTLDDRLREVAAPGTRVALGAHASLLVTDAVCAVPRLHYRYSDETPTIPCRVDGLLRNEGREPASITDLLGDALRPSLELANGEHASLVARDEVPAEPGAGGGDPRSALDESKVLHSPWRGVSVTPFGRRTLAPGKDEHIVWLGNVRLRRSEVVLGFRPARLWVGSGTSVRLEPAR